MTHLTTLFVGHAVGSDARGALPEFSLVRLLRGATGTAGSVISAGTVGTIVEVCGEGVAYLVEFSDPDEVALIPADDLHPST